MKKFLLVALFLAAAVSGWGRGVYGLNKGWKFYLNDERDSVRVNLPHTWNSSDATGGNVGYYRGTGNYFRHVYIRPEWRGKRVFVKFYGANTVTDLMVNGRHAGEHKGGSNAFCFEITDLLDYRGRNLLWVMVSNAERSDVLPTAGEEVAYGGLFRNMELVVTDQNIIGMDGWGGDGVAFAVSSASDSKACGEVDVTVNSPSGGNFIVDVAIKDAKDSLVYCGQVKHKADKGISEVKVPFEIDSPRLWCGVKDPYLYSVAVCLNDDGKKDLVSFRTGIRTVGVDAKDGFLLNGERYPLRGVIVWRDRAGSGIVASADDISHDVALIREMGANAVRVAGGTHCPEFYSRCDQEGVVVVTDGPLIGAATLDSKGFFNTAAFRDNAHRQFKEMILQRNNNPSVVAWNVFVEPEILEVTQNKFINEITAAVKKEDPTRFTIGVSNKDGELNRIPDAIIWSHTLGWLSGMPEDIGIWRDQLRRDPAWNKVCSAVGYRAGASVNHYSEKLQKPNPYGWRHPENWQSRFHEVYFKTLAGDDRMWALFAGNMFDYASPRYIGGDNPGVNDCGMVSFDRNVRKDSFWFYKANWNIFEQFVYITGKRHVDRHERVQTVTVYSNMPSVELFVDGVSKGVLKGRNGTFVWNGVELKEGANNLSVKAFAAANQNIEQALCEDSAVLNYTPSGRI